MTGQTSGETNASISIIDWLGKVGDGVGVLLSLKIGNKLYEMGYWINPENDYRVVMDKQFMTDYRIIDIYEFEGLESLLQYIHAEVLPPLQKMFAEFNLI